MDRLARLSGRNFLVIGRAGMDLYADPPGTTIENATAFTTALGGSSANIAVALTRQGCFLSRHVISPVGAPGHQLPCLYTRIVSRC
jgi:hypothetical protein